MLSDDVYVAAKKIAESSGRSLGEVVSQLVRKGLVAEPSRFTGADVAESRASSSHSPVVEGFTKNLGNLRHHRDGFHPAIVESGVHIGRSHPL